MWLAGWMSSLTMIMDFDEVSGGDEFDFEEPIDIVDEPFARLVELSVVIHGVCRFVFASV